MNNRNISICGREISNNLPPYIIAEVSANHNGSIERAKNTISLAKKCGADAVKIQTYTPDTMTIDCDSIDFHISSGPWQGRSLYELYGEAYTPFEWHSELFKHAADVEITIFSSPFDETAVDLLDSLNVPAYKIASFEIVDLPLIKYVAQKKKPVILSTGMASIQEIREAVEVCKKEGNNEIILLHCISSYPTPLQDANLHNISLLRDEFELQVGLSDHTLNSIASVTATSIGASVIEKHFTTSRCDGGVDSHFSMEPNELQNL